jgi:hypothetical protein
MPVSKKLKQKRRFTKVVKKPAQAEFTLRAKDLPEIFETISIRRKRKPRAPKEKVGTMPVGEKKTGPSYQTYIPPRPSVYPTAPSYIPIQAAAAPALTKSDIQSVFTASLEDLARGYKQIGESKAVSQPIMDKNNERRQIENTLTAKQIDQLQRFGYIIEEEEEEEKSIQPEQPQDKPPVPPDQPRAQVEPKPKPKVEIEDEDEEDAQAEEEFLLPLRKNTSALAIADIRKLKNQGATEDQLRTYLKQYKARHKTARDAALLIAPDLQKIADDLKAKYDTKKRTIESYSKAILEKL